MIINGNEDSDQVQARAANAHDDTDNAHPLPLQSQSPLRASSEQLTHQTTNQPDQSYQSHRSSLQSEQQSVRSELTLDTALRSQRIARQSAGTIGKFDVVSSVDYYGDYYGGGDASVASASISSSARVAAAATSLRDGRDDIDGSYSVSTISSAVPSSANVNVAFFSTNPTSTSTTSTIVQTNQSFPPFSQQNQQLPRLATPGAPFLAPTYISDQSPYEQKAQEKKHSKQQTLQTMEVESRQHSQQIRQKLEGETDARVYEPGDGGLITSPFGSARASVPFATSLPSVPSASSGQSALSAQSGQAVEIVEYGDKQRPIGVVQVAQAVPFGGMDSAVAVPKEENERSNMRKRRVFIIVGVAFLVIVCLSLGIALGVKGSKSSDASNASVARDDIDSDSELDTPNSPATTNDENSQDSEDGESGDEQENEGIGEIGETLNGASQGASFSAGEGHVRPATTTGSSSSPSFPLPMDPPGTSMTDNGSGAGSDGVGGSVADFSAGSSEEQCYKVSFELITDDYDETSVSLINFTALQSADTNDCSECFVYNENWFESNQELEKEFCLSPSEYTFIVDDIVGDGMNSTGFTLKIHDQTMQSASLVIQDGNDFGRMDATTFPVPFDAGNLYLLQVEIDPPRGAYWMVYQGESVKFINFEDYDTAGLRRESKYLPLGEYQLVLSNIWDGEFNIQTKSFNGDEFVDEEMLGKVWTELDFYSLSFSLPSPGPEYYLLEVHVETLVLSGDGIRWELQTLGGDIIFHSFKNYKSEQIYREGKYIPPGDYQITVLADENNDGAGLHVRNDVSHVKIYWKGSLEGCLYEDFWATPDVYVPKKLYLEA